MIWAVLAAVLIGVALGWVLVWWTGRGDPPPPVAGRPLVAIAPEVEKAPILTRGNRPLDQVTRSEITRLITAGRKMEAIRLLHASSDLSLLAAKSRVEEWSESVERRLLEKAYADASDLDHAEIDAKLAADLREMLGYRWGRWRALKLLRRHTTMRLVDAWDYLESVRRTSTPTAG